MSVPERRPVGRWLLTGLVVLAALIAAMWFHLLPGGWFLRNLVEEPGARADRLRSEHRAERLAIFTSENAGLPSGAVVFVGSSTIERFPAGALFPDLRCANRGIGAESAREIAGWLREALPDARPAGVVLYAGSVDLRREGASAVEAARRVERLIDVLRTRHGDVPVVLLGVLPTRSTDAAERAVLDEFDGALVRLAADRDAIFVSVRRPPLVTPEGRLARDWSVDHDHLGAAGYARVADWLAEAAGPVGELLASSRGR